MPAAPYGVFSVAGVDYLWHGNGVIRGEGRSERLWHGPFLQRLVREFHKHGGIDADVVRKILESLENDPSIASAPMEGPGAYPGGADDLHPVPLPK